MPLINPVIIGGKIVGAYVDETFKIDGQGNATLTELLQYILDVLNGGGYTPLANNGLNVDGGVTQLGGPLIENTTVTNTNRELRIGKDLANDKAIILQDSPSKFLSIHHENATDLSYMALSPTGYGMNVQNKTLNINSQVDLNYQEAAMTVNDLTTVTILSGIIAYTDKIAMYGLRTYASTAAAQADATLDVGGLYRLIADSVVRIKI